MDAKEEKYYFDESELGAVEWGLMAWLEKNAKPEAAKTYMALAEIQCCNGTFGPVYKLTPWEQKQITSAHDALDKAAAWPKAEGCYEQECD